MLNDCRFYTMKWSLWLHIVEVVGASDYHEWRWTIGMAYPEIKSVRPTFQWFIDISRLICATFNKLYFGSTTHPRCKVNSWHTERIDEAIGDGVYEIENLVAGLMGERWVGVMAKASQIVFSNWSFVLKRSSDIQVGHDCLFYCIIIVGHKLSLMWLQAVVTVTQARPAYCYFYHY